MLVTPLSFPLAVGVVILINGTTSPDSESFSINLGTGTDFDDNIALQFKPRFNAEVVARNTLTDEWGEEENDGGFPFTNGSAYEVEIVVEEGQYQVSVNGSHFCNYTHRLPIDSVRNIFISGDTKANVSVIKTVYPLPFPLTAGKDITVKGVVKTKPYRFSINLSNGTGPNKDILLHFDARFDQNKVVRNHFHGDWGEEETDGFIPFAPGAPFEARFAVKDNYTEVYVNRLNFCKFNHRLDKHVVRNVFIEGDVENITFEFVDTVHPLPFPLTAGVDILVKGVVKTKPYRFAINLASGTDANEDILLHFNARFDQNKVVRNSLHGDWGEEESKDIMPFAPGAPFEARFAVKDSYTEVYVNHDHICKFNHRLDKHVVRNVFIEGDVENSTVEFVNTVHPLPYPLTAGVDILVKGVVKTKPYRFTINLASGTDTDEDILLHFNPRFDQNKVVMDSFHGGRREQESSANMPFAPGAPFEARFIVKDSYIEVFVNGKFFCNFNRRGDKPVVRNVFIAGDVENSSVELIDMKPLYNPSVPFCTPIKGGMAPGSKLSVTGRPMSNPERFNINLVCGAKGESDDLALHFDVRINYGEIPNFTVRNIRQKGVFPLEREERGEPFFPFAAGVDFNITIVAENECFQIYVNEKHFAKFNYRIQPVQKVDHIYVQGTVIIDEVRFR